MIRRTIDNQHWLFTQPDHAAWAARVAECVGNDRFQSATRNGALIACAEHDAGWPIHDDAPQINKHHQPMDVFEVPPFLAFDIWAESSKRAAAKDAYAGLLVSLHGLALSVFASTHVAKSHPELARDLSYKFTLNKFQHAEIELQEELRTRLGLRTDIPLQSGLSTTMDDPAERELLFHFRLLQATDRLSLAMLCDASPFQSMELLPDPDSSPVQFTLNRTSDFSITLDPWPFNQPKLNVPIAFRRIPKIAYADDAQLRKEYASAAVETTDTFVCAKG